MVQENFSFEWKHFNSMDFGSYGIGASISPAGSQLANTNTAINWGVNNLELSMGHEMTFQQAGHLAQLGGLERGELVRLANLNRINLSVHAPIVDPAGVGQEGFSEDARKAAIRELKNSIDFADQIGTRSNIKNVPIVMHAAHYPYGNPAPQEKIVYVDRDTGHVGLAQAKDVTYKEDHLKKYGLISKEEAFPEKYGGSYRTEAFSRLYPEQRAEYNKRIAEIRSKGDWDYEHTEQKDRFKLAPSGELRMKNSMLMQGIDSQIANYRYHVRIDESHKVQVMAEFEDAKKRNDTAAMQRAAMELKGVGTDIDTYKRERERLEAQKYFYKHEFGGKVLEQTEDYAKEKIAKTIAELAEYSFKKESKPMLVVENWVPESVAGDPKKVAEIIAKARDNFANKLMQEQHYSSNEAAKQAEAIIGVNFDIGHANLWKKYQKWDESEGKMVEYTNEDIKKWATQVYPYLKHVHLTDNFGDLDAHLPLGWGNAPIKEVIAGLKEKGWSGRAILETFGAIAYGAGAPGAFGVAQSLYETGMPLAAGGPSWEQAAGTYFQSGYSGFTGHPAPGGTYWPDVGQYAVGFSGLPYSSGSRMPGRGGEGSQFAGAPMS